MGDLFNMIFSDFIRQSVNLRSDLHTPTPSEVGEEANSENQGQRQLTPPSQQLQLQHQTSDNVRGNEDDIPQLHLPEPSPSHSSDTLVNTSSEPVNLSARENLNHNNPVVTDKRKRYKNSLNDKFTALELMIGGKKLSKPEILSSAIEYIRCLVVEKCKLEAERAQKEVAENNKRKFGYDQMMLQKTKLENENKQLKELLKTQLNACACDCSLCSFCSLKK